MDILLILIVTLSGLPVLYVAAMAAFWSMVIVLVILGQVIERLSCAIRSLFSS